MIKKTKSIRILFMITLILFGSFIDVSTIRAEAGTRKGSIQIIYKGRNHSDEEVILSGAKFAIFPIQYKKNDEWIWQNGFENSGVSLGDTSAEAREKQAKDLFGYAEKRDISGITQTTDDLGHASFVELEEGIYLIAQIGNVECGTDKFESAPFLVNIPSEINGEAEYDVVIEPKGEWVSPVKPPVTPTNPDKPTPADPAPTEPTPAKPILAKPTPAKPDIPDHIRKIIDIVKTGDTTNIIPWVLIAIGSLAVIIVLYRKRKGK